MSETEKKTDAMTERGSGPPEAAEGARTDADDALDLLPKLAEAWEAGDVARAVELTRRVAARTAALGAPSGPLYRSALAWAAEDRPAPVLRRAGDAEGACLSAGDVGVLAAAGGGGKSSAVLSLALAAAPERSGRPEVEPAKGDEPGPSAPDGWGRALGLEVRTGPVLYLTWEDPGAVAGARAELAARRLHGAPDAAGNLLVAPMRAHGPLYAPPGVEAGGSGLTNTLPEATGAWVRTWDAARRLADKGTPPLVVIDPATSSMMGDVNSWHLVRRYIDHLADVAAGIGAGIGSAVLVVHHSTKSAKWSVGDPGGDVAGAATWADAARCVLVLDRHDGGPPVMVKGKDGKKRPETVREWRARRAKELAQRRADLVAQKVNHGADGWTVELACQTHYGPPDGAPDEYPGTGPVTWREDPSPPKEEAWA